jgi:hypothetical protein
MKHVFESILEAKSTSLILQMSTSTSVFTYNLYPGVIAEG